MSAQENKKLMQEIFAAVATGDRSRFVETLADDVTMHVTGQYSWSQTFEGKTSLINDLYGYLRKVLVEPRRAIPLRFVADEDCVVVQARGNMITKTGVPYENDYCMIYRFANGKIVEIWEYCDSVLTESVLGPFPAKAN